jgi:hypothetical protein
MGLWFPSVKGNVVSFERMETRDETHTVPSLSLLPPSCMHLALEEYMSELKGRGATQITL